MSPRRTTSKRKGAQVLQLSLYLQFPMPLLPRDGTLGPDTYPGMKFSGLGSEGRADGGSK